MGKKTTLDLSYLRQMSGGDEEMQRLLLEMLAAELDRDLPRLHQLAQAKNWSELAGFCHHLKSTLLFSGDKMLIHANSQLMEHARKDGQTGLLVEPCLTIIEKNGRQVLREVKRLLDQA